MTLYLTDSTTSQDIIEAKQSGIVHSCKLYPAGATTNSELGVTQINKIEAVLKTMAECGMILSVHSEVALPSVDVFDREKVFIDAVLKPLMQRYLN